MFNLYFCLIYLIVIPTLILNQPFEEGNHQNTFLRGWLIFLLYCPLFPWRNCSGLRALTINIQRSMWCTYCYICYLTFCLKKFLLISQIQLFCVYTLLFPSVILRFLGLFIFVCVYLCKYIFLLSLVSVHKIILTLQTAAFKMKNSIWYCYSSCYTATDRLAQLPWQRAIAWTGSHIWDNQTPL